MSLRLLAHSATVAINGDVIGMVFKNTGPTVGYGGKRTPSFARLDKQALQVQSASTRALKRADSLNIQGVMREVYWQGDFTAVDRVSKAGGDLVFFRGNYWLVEEVLEAWDGDGWSRALVTKQLQPADGYDEEGNPL